MAKAKQETIVSTTVVSRTASDVTAEFVELGEQIDALQARRDELKAQLIAFVKDPRTQAVTEAGKSMTKTLPNGLSLVLTFKDKRAANATFLSSLPKDVQIRLMKPDVTAIQKFYKDDPEKLALAAPVVDVTTSFSVKSAK